MSEDELSADPTLLTVSLEATGARLDAFLAEQFPRFSRVHLRRVIAAGGVTVDGKSPKVAYRLRGGEVVSIHLPPIPRASAEPEDIPLDVLYEDEHLVAISKPAPMVVHPARGHWSGTLTSALAFHFEKLSSTGGPTRPGIVHRLDRETSGVLVVAKTDEAHYALAAQFESRRVTKEYFAIVVGSLNHDRDWIKEPIGIHPYQREKMAIRAGHPTSRDAETFYEVSERFAGFCAVRVLPRTGRTHQIRVHLAHLGHPVLCDKLYGGRSRITRGELLGKAADDQVLLDHHALHARRLTIAHPVSGATLTFEAPLPIELTSLLDELRQRRSLVN